MKDKNTYYITTPIYYPSGRPHIGTAYTTILAETMKNFKKMQGYDVRLLTGSDEHGLKIQEAAEKVSLSPEEYTLEQYEIFKELWELLEIDYDQFIRTSSDMHKKAAAKVFDKFMEQGDIYLDKYEGWYCKPCETFFTELELVEGKCPMCNRDVVWTEEEAYFFNMKKYQKVLEDIYKENPNFILPESRKNEIFNNFIEPGIENLCVSRTSFDWGIPVMKNPKHVIYVWVDALSSYITALGYMGEDDYNFKKYWPADLHIVGKDIIRFHAIYWPIFLKALGLELPKQIYAHGFFMARDGKMSKSKGNSIYPDVLVKRYGLDATKFALLHSLSYSQDSVFGIEEMIDKYNTYLANDLGNLLNRTIGMLNKYLDGVIPSISKNTLFKDFEGMENLDINSTTYIYTKELNEFVRDKMKELDKNFEEIHIANGIENIFEVIDRANKYIDKTEPWVKYKQIQTNIETRTDNNDKLELIMYTLVEILRKISVAIRPFMKKTSDQIQEQLNIKGKYNIDDWNEIFKFNTRLNDIKVVEEGVPLFQRIEKEEEIEYYNEFMKD